MEVAIFLGLYPCKQGFKLLDPFFNFVSAN